MGCSKIIGDPRLSKRVGARYQHDRVSTEGVIGLSDCLAQAARRGGIYITDIVAGCSYCTGRRIVKPVDEECRIRQRHHNNRRDSPLMQSDDSRSSINVDSYRENIDGLVRIRTNYYLGRQKIGGTRLYIWMSNKSHLSR